MTIGKNRPVTFQQAKAQFPHRYTMEHVPNWAKLPNPGNGKWYAPQYRTDLEWYDNTYFHGESDQADKTSCYSFNKSWPLGQWLDYCFSDPKKKPPLLPYSVLLLYPDNLNDSGTETYFTHVKASSEAKAVKAAQKKAKRACTDDVTGECYCDNANDFVPLLLVAGYQESLSLYGL